MTSASEDVAASAAQENQAGGEALLAAAINVAHAAWHMLDDGGEQDDDPDEFVGFMSDAKRLSDALDALEALGWDAHPDDRPTPPADSKPA